MPRIEGLDYYGECRPAGNVGGDFLDFVPQPGNCLAVSVGEVSANEAAAAIMMSGLQAFLRGLTARPGLVIARMVEELNRAVYQTAPDHFYATLFYARVDASRGQIDYVSAGHEPALLVRARNGRVQRLDGTGTVLGLTARSAYERRSLTLERGDVLVAFTDGITEAVDREGRELGQAGVLRIIHRYAHAPASELVARIMEEAGRYPAQADDRTAVAIRFAGAAAVAPEPAEESVELAMAAA